MASRTDVVFYIGWMGIAFLMMFCGVYCISAQMDKLGIHGLVAGFPIPILVGVAAPTREMILWVVVGLLLFVSGAAMLAIWKDTIEDARKHLQGLADA